MSGSQGFGRGQDTHPTHVIRDDTPHLLGHHWLQVITLYCLSYLCYREFGALSSRLVTVVIVCRVIYSLIF